MTKQEHKLKSMLNYLEVDMGGKKDEKMTKKELQRFLDSFNQILDFYMLQEIMKKIKENRQSQTDDEEKDDFMFPSKNDEFNDENDKFEEHMKNPENFFGSGNPKNNSPKNWNDPIDTDINKFLKWLTMVLYSGDHSVIITEDKTGINIKLVKINKGKK